MNKRYILFGIFGVVTLAIYAVPLRELFRQSFRSELYSHIVIIPLVSGYFFYEKREKVDSIRERSFWLGGMLIAVALLLFLVGKSETMKLSRNDSLSVAVFSAWLFWTGGFLFFIGPHALRAACFPLLFLLFVIPIPDRLVEGYISALQFVSAEVSYILFRITGVPVVREGYLFHLPGMSIEVAKQCSGVRSSIALVITSVIAGHLFLRTGWARLVLVLSTFPIAVFKNGVRIATLSLLGVYVDPRLLGSQLHKSGGIPFFVIALMMLALVLWILRKSERIKWTEHKDARREVRGVRGEA
jgi:exosortase